jgi:hypothetical protein
MKNIEYQPELKTPERYYQLAMDLKFAESIKAKYTHLHIIAFNNDYVLSVDELTGKAFYFLAQNGSIPCCKLSAFDIDMHAWAWYINVLNSLKYTICTGGDYDVIVKQINLN